MKLWWWGGICDGVFVDRASYFVAGNSNVFESDESIERPNVKLRFAEKVSNLKFGIRKKASNLPDAESSIGFYK